MATCKDCLHCEVCVIVEHNTSDDEDYLTEFGCEDFKDRTNWTEKKHGRWIDNRTNIICSVCKSEYSDEIIFMNRNFEYEDLEYCPHCGSIMDGEDDG